MTKTDIDEAIREALEFLDMVIEQEVDKVNDQVDWLYTHTGFAQRG